jgi:hypothetical protein
LFFIIKFQKIFKRNYQSLRKKNTNKIQDYNRSCLQLGWELALIFSLSKEPGEKACKVGAARKAKLILIIKN